MVDSDTWKQTLNESALVALMVEFNLGMKVGGEEVVRLEAGSDLQNSASGGVFELFAMFIV